MHEGIFSLMYSQPTGKPRWMSSAVSTFGELTGSVDSPGSLLPSVSGHSFVGRSLPYSLWKSSERPISKFSTPFRFLTQSSPLHRQLTSTASSPGNLRANITLKCRTPMSMGIQMEEATTADQSKAPEPELVEVPTVVEIAIPPESLVGFEADYERVFVTWPADLATTTEYAKLEQFVTSAHGLARRWLPEELVSRLESYIYDLSAPPALVIRGLPIDKELPPTGRDADIKKAGKCVSETWLVGIARIVGQVFSFGLLPGAGAGMGLLVRQLYTTDQKVNHVSPEGSRELLNFHLDFFHVMPEKFPNVIAWMGIRGDPHKEGHTLLCNNRKLYRMLDQADIEVLRTEIITWDVPFGQFSRHVIEGSESSPQINVFDEDLHTMGGFENVVQGSPEARAAYKRVKEIALTLAEGVWLDGGDVLLLNQKKACHGRGPFVAKYDGHDRWLQRTYINSGGFWEVGFTQWPDRSLPLNHRNLSTYDPETRVG